MSENKNRSENFEKGVRVKLGGVLKARLLYVIGLPHLHHRLLLSSRPSHSFLKASFLSFILLLQYQIPSPPLLAIISAVVMKYSTFVVAALASVQSVWGLMINTPYVVSLSGEGWWLTLFLVRSTSVVQCRASQFLCLV